jgi:DNA-binding Xre family transcriptional regulator
MAEIRELNEVRLERDLTYRELADEVGISFSQLHHLLNSPKPPDVNDRTLFKLRRYLEEQRPTAMEAAR